MNNPLVMIMNGINLNMLGQRDSDHYGQATLEDLNCRIKKLAEELKLQVDFFQSNCEGAFVEKIHSLPQANVAGLVINAGAWTHYSYGIMDALAILKMPIVEVHLSNVRAREEFRHFSVLAKVTRGCIAGFGVNSYLLALRALAELI